MAKTRQIAADKKNAADTDQQKATKLTNDAANALAIAQAAVEASEANVKGCTDALDAAAEADKPAAQTALDTANADLAKANDALTAASKLVQEAADFQAKVDEEEKEADSLLSQADKEDKAQKTVTDKLAIIKADYENRLAEIFTKDESVYEVYVVGVDIFINESAARNHNKFVKKGITTITREKWTTSQASA